MVGLYGRAIRQANVAGLYDQDIWHCYIWPGYMVGLYGRAPWPGYMAGLYGQA